MIIEAESRPGILNRATANKICDLHAASDNAPFL
jgi:hypothetical protein